MKRQKWPAQRTKIGIPATLGRYRFESAAALGLAIVVAFLLLYTPAQEQRRATEGVGASAPVRATSTAIPRAVGATVAPTYVAPRMTREEAIKLVAALPSYRQPGRTLGDTVGDQWTAEYRGDGTWMVRAGEPAWLLLEEGPAAMPANVAAINLQGADRGRYAR